MLNATFEHLGVEPGKKGGFIHQVLVRIDGPELIGSCTWSKRWEDWDELEGLFWETIVSIGVFKSSKCSIRLNSKETANPVVRCDSGPCEAVWSRDKSGLLSAAGELAFYWLSMTRFDGKLQFPMISDKIIHDTDMDSCTDCRWCRAIPFESGDIVGGMDEEEEGNGIAGRYQPYDSYNKPAVSPRYQCLLFNLWLEEHWGILDELNHMMSGGISHKQILNARAEYGDQDWHNLEYMRNAMLSGKACLFHRQRPSESGRFSQFEGGLTKHLIINNRPVRGDQKKGGFWDIIPAGWMPKVDEGILIPGFVALWSEDLPISLIREEQSHVQQGMQTGQEQMPSGLGSPTPGQQADTDRRDCDISDFAVAFIEGSWG